MTSKGLILAAAASLATVGGVAYAAIPDGNTIHGCYEKVNGDLRVVKVSTACKPSEVALSWNQQGPKGDQGAQGLQGVPGRDGVDGQNGVDGTAAAEDLDYGDAAAKGCAPPAYSYDFGGAPAGGTVDDPLFARQWGLDQINAPEAWARGAMGAGAIIAVIDTGVDLKHPDLKGKLVGGIDLVAGETDCPRGPQDEHGHGTHVAGIAAAETDNGIGIAGVAPRARIMPVRVLDAEGVGSIEDIAAGIRWAADNGADVLNLSFAELPVLGQDEEINSDIEAAVDYAWAKGAVIVAAGGDAPSLCSYPSYARQAICVAAADRRGLPTYYSSLTAKGPEQDPECPVDALLAVVEGGGRSCWREPLRALRAPGGAGTVLAEDDENVWGPIWPGAEADGGAIEGYDALAGTGMATAFVSGVAALLVGQGLTNQQIIDRLTVPYGGPVQFGIVDADAATAAG